jgi:hypothetical protein
VVSVVYLLGYRLSVLEDTIGKYDNVVLRVVVRDRVLSLDLPLHKVLSGAEVKPESANGKLL